MTDEERERTPGAAGHPEPGSGHDDSKSETVEDGPPRTFTDGVPGATERPVTRGGAITEVELLRKGDPDG
jgi:hypothetical protein